MTTLPSYDDAARTLFTTLTRHRAETGLALQPENFVLRVHPDEWRSWIATADALSGGFASQLVANGSFMGFRVDLDTDVEPGHPVLRCTWEMTL